MLLSALKAVFVVLLLVGGALGVAAAENVWSLKDLLRLDDQNATPKDVRLAIINNYQDKNDFGLLEEIDYGLEKETLPKEGTLRIDMFCRGVKKAAAEGNRTLNDFFLEIPCDSDHKYYVRNCLAIALEFLMAALPLFPSNVDSNSATREKIITGMKYCLMNLCFEKAEEAGAPNSSKKSWMLSLVPNIIPNVFSGFMPSWSGSNKGEGDSLETAISSSPAAEGAAEPVISLSSVSAELKDDEDKPAAEEVAEPVVSSSSAPAEPKDENRPAGEEAVEPVASPPSTPAELKDEGKSAKAVDAFQTLPKGTEFDPCLNLTDLQKEEQAIRRTVIYAVKLIAKYEFYEGTVGEYSVESWQNYFAEQCLVYTKKLQQHKLHFMALNANLLVTYLQEDSSKNPSEDYFLLSGITGTAKGKATPNDIRRAIINNYQNERDFGLLQRLGSEGKEEIFRIDSLYRWGEKITEQDYAFNGFVSGIPDSRSQYYVRFCFVRALEFLMQALPLFSGNQDNNLLMREKIITGMKYFLINLCFEKAEKMEPVTSTVAIAVAGSIASAETEQKQVANSPAAEAVSLASQDQEAQKIEFKILRDANIVFDPNLEDMEKDMGVEEDIRGTTLKALHLIIDHDFNKNKQRRYTIDDCEAYWKEQCFIYGRKPDEVILNFVTLTAFLFEAELQIKKLQTEMDRTVNKYKISPGDLKRLIDKVNKKTGGHLDNIASEAINLMLSDRGSSCVIL